MVKEYKAYIDNQWIETPDRRIITSPYDLEPAGLVHFVGKIELKMAIDAAVRAFEETKKLPTYKREQILLQIKDGLIRRKEEIARVMAMEAGKPIKDARAEVARSIFTFGIAAEETKRIHGEIIALDLMETSRGRIGLVGRFPIGPIVGIAPFNFPLNLVVHKVAPAIASGNSIIIKPASQTPICSLILAEIISQTELPSGAFNVVPCPGSQSALLVEDEKIKMLTFTGSAEVGWRLKEKAGKKRIILELGGNAAVIVHNDANIEYAVKRCVFGSFVLAGQVCISVQRIYLHTDIYDIFMEKFIEQSAKQKVGDPLDEDTDIGPMIDDYSAQKTEEWINEAVAGGAKILLGGKRNKRLFEPTILCDVQPHMKVSCQEVFAPVVVVYRYEDFNDAIKEVNNSIYGLQAGVFTRDFGRIFKSWREIDTGGIIINDVPTYRIDHMPYGGMKDSGIGREGIKYAIEEMTEIKHLALNTEV